MDGGAATATTIDPATPWKSSNPHSLVLFRLHLNGEPFRLGAGVRRMLVGSYGGFEMNFGGFGVIYFNKGFTNSNFTLCTALCSSLGGP